MDTVPDTLPKPGPTPGPDPNPVPIAQGDKFVVYSTASGLISRYTVVGDPTKVTAQSLAATLNPSKTEAIAQVSAQAAGIKPATLQAAVNAITGKLATWGVTNRYVKVDANNKIVGMCLADPTVDNMNAFPGITLIQHAQADQTWTYTNGLFTAPVVKQPPVAILSITTLTQQVQHGLPFLVTVTAATLASYKASVQFASSDPLAKLPPTSALTNGVGVFSVTLNTVGTNVLAVSDSFDSPVALSQPFTVI